MLVRPVSREWEIWKWVAAISLATILALLFASAVGAADIPGARSKPRQLSPEITDWAKPMNLGQAPERAAIDDPECTLSQALDLQRQRKYDEALEIWNDLTLPPETEVWKWIAMGQAHLAAERLEQAERFLGRAVDMQPDNAVAYYFRGILRIQQAYLATEWPEDFVPQRTRLVTYDPQKIVPNTKSLYELAATMDLERAIEDAKSVQLDEPLLAGSSSLAATQLTVGDLLVALGADRFEAKAHSALSYLYLERGTLEVAERHMDSAVDSGLEVLYGYETLGDEYRKRGQPGDAFRAYLKGVQFTPNKMHLLREASECLRELFTNP